MFPGSAARSRTAYGTSRLPCHPRRPGVLPVAWPLTGWRSRVWRGGQPSMGPARAFSRGISRIAGLAGVPAGRRRDHRRRTLRPARSRWGGDPGRVGDRFPAAPGWHGWRCGKLTSPRRSRGRRTGRAPRSADHPGPGRRSRRLPAGPSSSGRRAPRARAGTRVGRTGRTGRARRPAQLDTVGYQVGEGGIGTSGRQVVRVRRDEHASAGRPGAFHVSRMPAEVARPW